MHVHFAVNTSEVQTPYTYIQVACDFLQQSAPVYVSCCALGSAVANYTAFPHQHFTHVHGCMQLGRRIAGMGVR